jgi:hypothetical protein
MILVVYVQAQVLIIALIMARLVVAV